MATPQSDSRFEVLELEDASRLAKTLSSPTCKKILDHLENKEQATASELSSALDIALSTVHYHLKALSRTGIVDDSSFHYSEKGKEVIHYTLRDKAIIIIPRKNSASSTLRKQLQSLAPGILTVAALAGGSLIYKGIESSKERVSESAPRMLEAAADVSSSAAGASSTPITLSSLISSPEFLIGLGCALIILVFSVLGMQLLRIARDERGKGNRRHHKR
ncbi:MAG: ArsR/SmtB family transcription factor [Candidatus Woesearchaeota archaeon]